MSGGQDWDLKGGKGRVRRGGSHPSIGGCGDERGKITPFLLSFFFFCGLAFSFTVTTLAMPFQTSCLQIIPSCEIQSARYRVVKVVAEKGQNLPRL